MWCQLCLLKQCWSVFFTCCKLDLESVIVSLPIRLICVNVRFFYFFLVMLTRLGVSIVALISVLAVFVCFLFFLNNVKSYRLMWLK